MRLCYIDWLYGPLKDLTLNEAKKIYEIGFRVAGINSGDLEASDKDIDRVKNIINDAGLVAGPYGGGRATFHPDPAVCKEYKKGIVKALKIGGKLGCTNIRYSVGSMDPNNIWKHHPLNHTQKALDMLIESTRELIPVAEDCNCALGPETTQGTIVGTVPRMKEYVDRLNSPYAQIVFDPVNHMGAERIYESGKFIKCAIAELGDRIGEIHVKDAQVKDDYMFYFGEAPMGTGLLDHAALMNASNSLEPWKTFSLEHIGYDYKSPENYKATKKAYDYIMSVAERIGHKFTDPNLTREKWEKIKKY
jgi:sugar phosphate isomerase/epimerase